MTLKKPTIGLALSGSGNRTTFYIGFLEVLSQHNIKVDYIAACSGGSVVAAAYACGTLEILKNFALTVTKEEVKKLIKKSQNGSGFYALDLIEEEIQNRLTKGATFEEVKTKMAFIAVDIDTGEKVPLCIGDIAKAACISSTVPGLIEASRWGRHTLVDGGILTIVPMDVLQNWQADISIGINMRSTKHIFTERQITLKKAFNFLKKMLFVEEIESWIKYLFPGDEDEDSNKIPGLFAVWGKSLDLVIKTSSKKQDAEPEGDLMIVPDFKRLKRSDVSRHAMVYHYELGRKCALENLPKILELIKAKSSQ